MGRSRVIRWLRVMLPILALMLLSTLFLAARKPGPDPVLPYVTNAPEDAERGTGIAGADYAARLRDGSELRVTAGHAVPQGRDGQARDMRVVMSERDGAKTTVTAPNGKIVSDQLTLSGGVRVTTSAGWDMLLPQVSADMADGTITGEGGVTATAPFGELTADQASLRPDPGGGRVLNLNGRVRLIYHP